MCSRDAHQYTVVRPTRSSGHHTARLATWNNRGKVTAHVRRKIPRRSSRTLLFYPLLRIGDYYGCSACVVRVRGALKRYCIAATRMLDDYPEGVSTTPLLGTGKKAAVRYTGSLQGCFTSRHHTVRRNK